MMTQQETDALRNFLAQLTQVKSVTRDAQANAMIQEATAQQPDASYLLVQRTMLQDQALQAARTQIAQLQTQLQAARDSSRPGAGDNAGTGFLDSGSNWGNSASEAPRNPVTSPARVPPQRFEAPGGVASPGPVPYGEPARPGFFGAGAGGFLGSMAATAAGVAGGAFLFQGIENMMGHHGSGSSGFLGQGNTGMPAENTTINNYYEGDSSGVSNRAPQDPFSNTAAMRNEGGDDLAASDNVVSNDDFGSDDEIDSV